MTSSASSTPITIPAPGSFQPRLALDREWRRRRPGALRRPQRRDGYLQRSVTSEFEAIYAVAHPGRARVHGFGIFGGSNGYWKTPVLRRTRMRGFMLTEDIDSSMRVDRRRGHGSYPILASSRPSWPLPTGEALGISDCAGPRAGRRSRCGTWSPWSATRASPAPAVRPRLPARLARGLPMDLPADIPDPGLLVPPRLATDRLVRADIRIHDDLHHERGRHAISGPPGAWRDPSYARSGAGSPCSRSRPSSSTPSTRT